MDSARLNNGTKIPILGLGVYQMPPIIITARAVRWALELGYRHIDTARIYYNEKAVGSAIKKSGVPREEIFLTTKLWNADQKDAVKACNSSLRKLQTDYVDLYLIHWPAPGTRSGAWKALESLYKEGKCRAIGVSNYTIRHLKELLDSCEVLPAVNQVEFSPYLYQKELLEFCKSKGIQPEAYSPLTRGKKLKDPKLVELASKYNKSPAQILIRWALQHDIVAIPKSTKKERIRENLGALDFTISKGDIEKMDSLNEDFRTCWDPTKMP